jgi:hypothetical protein
VNALGLLLLGAALHYGWALFPEHSALVWNIAGSATRLILLAMLLRQQRGAILGVGLWWACEELLVIGCNAAYIVSPWVVPKGQAMCSSLLGYDLGTVGLLIVAIGLWRLAVLRRRVNMNN